jgi:hypothetical protein
MREAGGWGEGPRRAHGVAMRTEEETSSGFTQRPRQPVLPDEDAAGWRRHAAPWPSLRWQLVALAVAAGLGLVVCLVPWQVERGSGALPLSVTVSSASGSSITYVSCEAVSSGTSARDSAENLIPPESRMFSSVADPFDGEPLRLTVPFGTHTNRTLLWASTRHSQAGWLVVIARFRDGRQEGRVVSIPDLRQASSLTVTFP